MTKPKAAQDGSTEEWPPEKVAMLRDHFARGLSNGQSAHLIGTTRNAVIAKRHRLGLVREPATPPVNWSVEMEEMVRSHWRAGVSARDSGAEFDPPLSAYIIRTKRERMGLAHTLDAGPEHALAEKARRDVYAHTMRLAGIGSRASEAPKWTKTALPEIAPSDTDLIGARTFIDLERGECRWPLQPTMAHADALTLFCGRPVIGGCYCATHHERAYGSPDAPPPLAAVLDDLVDPRFREAA